MNEIKEFKAGKLNVKIYETRQEMGKAAAKEAGNTIRELFKNKDILNIVFAAAPSQNDFLESLLEEEIKWNKINVFHMDEYIKLDADAPQGFGNFLKEKFFSKVNCKSVNYINGNAEDAEKECLRYTKLLQENPIDIVFMGIGENGHIAFNDPKLALFNDPKAVKVVRLEEKSRKQQVNDGCFERLDLVPIDAITLTIPTLIKPKYIFCVVPGKTKAEAVKNTVNGAVDEACPATILKNQNNAVLYTDKDSSSLL